METNTNKYSHAILIHMALESQAFQSSGCAFEKKRTHRSSLHLMELFPIQLFWGHKNNKIIPPKANNT